MGFSIRTDGMEAAARRLSERRFWRGQTRASLATTGNLNAALTPLQFFPETAVLLHGLEIGLGGRGRFLRLLQQRGPEAVRRFQELLPPGQDHPLEEIVGLHLDERTRPTRPIRQIVLPASDQSFSSEELPILLGGLFIFNWLGWAEVPLALNWTERYSPFPLTVPSMIPPDEGENVAIERFVRRYLAPDRWEGASGVFDEISSGIGAPIIVDPGRQSPVKKSLRYGTPSGNNWGRVQVDSASRTIDAALEVTTEEKYFGASARITYPSDGGRINSQIIARSSHSQRHASIAPPFLSFARQVVIDDGGPPFTADGEPGIEERSYGLAAAKDQHFFFPGAVWRVRRSHGPVDQFPYRSIAQIIQTARRIIEGRWGGKTWPADLTVNLLEVDRRKSKVRLEFGLKGGGPTGSAQVTFGGTDEGTRLAQDWRYEVFREGRIMNLTPAMEVTALPVSAETVDAVDDYVTGSFEREKFSLAMFRSRRPRGQS